jgi:hypothetical protein
MDLPGKCLLIFVITLRFMGVSLNAAPATTDYQQQNEKPSWPCYTLTAEHSWQLTSPNGERFDASALLLRRNDLLTVSDRGSSIYRIELFKDTQEANLILVPECFTAGQLAPFASEKVGRWDCEGLAEDSTHRLYICEEANRWVLRFDPKTREIERLAIDWSPVQKYFHPTDINASFEGIAVGKGKLFVANERQHGRILVVHLKTRAIIDNFTVRPSRTSVKDVHFSDLCWFENSLFALLRENHVIVKIDPTTHRILAEYDFGNMEHEADVEYESYSLMEGLAVGKDHIWLVTDNNGVGRKRFSKDIRPTLFKCLRPDR